MYIGIKKDVKAIFDGKYVYLKNINLGSYRIVTKTMAVLLLLLKGCRNIEYVIEEFVFLTGIDNTYFEKLIKALEGYVKVDENFFQTGINELENKHILIMQSIESLIDKDYPDNIYIKVTNLCDKRCKYCAEELPMKIKPKGFWDIENLKQLSLERAQNSCFELTGGEPLLHNNLKMIIDAFGQSGIEVGIITKGCNNAESFKEIMLKNIKNICFSLDSHKRKYVNDITQNDYTFDNIMKCISIAQMEKISVSVNAVITAQNKDKLEEFIEFYVSCKVVSIHFAVVRETKGCATYMLLSEEEKNALYRQVDCLRKKFWNKIGIELTNMKCSIGDMCKGCGKDLTDVKIDFDGEVTLCSGQVLGSLKEHSLYEIWNSDFSREIRKQILKQMTI